MVKQIKEYTINCMYCNNKFIFKRLYWYGWFDFDMQYELVCPNCYIKFSAKDLNNHYRVRRKKLLPLRN